MRSPIRAPDVGDEAPVLHLWFVHQGERVFAGDRVVELLLDGATFDVTAEETGVLTNPVALPGTHLTPGQVLGWIDKENDAN